VEYLHLDSFVNLVEKGWKNSAATSQRLVCDELGTTYVSSSAGKS
jgi:hypothetical protein